MVEQSQKSKICKSQTLQNYNSFTSFRQALKSTNSKSANSKSKRYTKKMILLNDSGLIPLN